MRLADSPPKREATPVVSRGRRSRPIGGRTYAKPYTLRRKAKPMSFQLMAWASEQRTGSPSRKAVLMALANAANHHSGKCHPSVARIAEETELSEPTVKRALADLAGAELIARKRRRRQDGSLGTYEYTFPPRDHGEPPTDHGDPLTRDHGDPAEPGTTEPGSESVLLPAATAAESIYDPLKGRKVDGQDLPWNALAEATQSGSKIDGSRMRRALDSIRADLWEWVQETRPGTVERAMIFPDEYERAVALTIAVVVNRLREEAPTLTWGPEGVARNFRRTLVADAEAVDVDAVVAAARRGHAA